MFDLSDYLVFAVHGGGDSSGGMAGALVSLLSFIEALVRQSPSESFAVLLPGVAALRNIHPLLVHFPIALLSLFFLLDVISSVAGRDEWRRVAGWFLYLGTGFAALTVAAGLMAAKSVAHGGNVHEIMENHEHLALSVLALAGGLSLWRWLAKGSVVGPANTLYVLLAAILCAMLAFTADLGGLMVYRYGVAVIAADEVNQEAALKHQHEATSDMAPIEESRPRPEETAVTNMPEVMPDQSIEPKTAEQKHSHAHHDHHHTH